MEGDHHVNRPVDSYDIPDENEPEDNIPDAVADPTEYSVSIGLTTDVTVYFDDDNDCWVVTGDLRAPGSGYSDDANYDASDGLHAEFPRIMFDCEMSCFFAYPKTRAEADALVERLRTWLFERRGDAFGKRLTWTPEDVNTVDNPPGM
jgi:hypothetical protein